MLNLVKILLRIYFVILFFYGLFYWNKILVSLLYFDFDFDIMILYDLYVDSVKLFSYYIGYFIVYNIYFLFKKIL